MSLPHIPFEAYRQRADRTRELLQSYSLDALLAAPSVNLRYLTGCTLPPSERFLALLFRREAPPVVIAPAFERERILASPLKLGHLLWRDEENPLEKLRSLIGDAPGIAIGLEPRTDFGLYMKLVRAVPEARWMDGSSLFEQLRYEKTAEEIACLEAAIRITEDAFAQVSGLVRPGISEREVACALISRMNACGGEDSWALAQFGEDAAIPHGAPGGRALSDGDMILIDMGTSVCGYHSDLTRVFAFRRAREALRDLYAIVREAQAAAIERTGPGVPADQVDRAARSVVERHEYGIYFTHRAGHGIGMDGHEPPFLVRGNTQALRPGVVVCIEPGVYLPGRHGVRLEDMVLVTHAGRILLSSGPGDLPVVT